MGKASILVVDDEPVVLSVAQELLGEDYDVFVASGAAEALEQIERQRIHVVVADYQLPGMDGIALLVEVKRRQPGVVRVLMTGYADMQLVIRALNEGEIHRFLSKPYKSFEFRRIVEEAVGISRIVERRAETPQGRTVLIAHDSTISQASLRMLLTPAYSVLTTANGIEALDLLATRRVDALVMGVGLEMLDGCTIASYLKKEKRAALPLVIWGSGVYGPYEEYLRECGADLVLDDANPEAAARLQQFLRTRLA